MNNIKSHYLQLDMAKSEEFRTISIWQGENKSNQLEMDLTHQFQSFNPTVTKTIILYDNEHGVPIVQSNATYANGKISCTIPDGIYQSIGKVRGQISLYNGEIKTQSGIFFIEVKQSVGIEVMAGRPEWGELDKAFEIAEKAEEWKVQEEQRKTNELDRVKKENDRNTSESARISAENTRISQESGRVSAENTRVSQESGRVTSFNNIKKQYEDALALGNADVAVTGIRTKLLQLIDDAQSLENDIQSLESSKVDRSTTINLQEQINRLVVNGTGDSNPEVVQARGKFDLLNNRLNFLDNMSDISMTKIPLKQSIKAQNSITIDGIIKPTTPSFTLSIYDVTNLKFVLVNGKLEVPSGGGSYADFVFADKDNKVLDVRPRTNTQMYEILSVPIGAIKLYLGTGTADYKDMKVCNIDEVQNVLDSKANLSYINNLEGKLNKNLIIDNLFDKNSDEIILGKSLGSDGLFYDSPTSFVTNFISISANDTLYGLYNSGVYFVCYDFNKTRIGYGYLSAGGSVAISTITTVPADKLPTIAYIRFSNSLADIDKITITIDKRRQRISNHKILPLNSLQYANNGLINWWENKKGDSLGDSLTGQGYFQRYTSMYYNLDVFSNHGVGGSKLSGANVDSSRPSMWQDERINALRNDADFITILGGQNDGNVTIGEISKTNFDTNTYVGAYNTIIDKIYKKYNGRIQMILCCPFYVPSEGDDGVRFITLGNAVKEIGKLHGLPVADFGGLSGANKYVKDIYWSSSDRTHPNENFYRDKITPILIETMSKVKPIDYSKINSRYYQTSQ